jgi:hypothetical protein
MISAFASIPAAYLSWRLEGRSDPTATIIQTGIQIAGLVIFLVITLSLRKLLNSRFRFHEADKSIEWMIRANVVGAALAVSAMQTNLLKDTLGIAIIVVMAAQGMVQILFGYRLLRLQNDLDGMLKPFCYLNMATGVCLASVVLILVGIALSALSDLLLGTIFFHMARKLSGLPDSEEDLSRH